MKRHAALVAVTMGLAAITVGCSDSGDSAPTTSPVPPTESPTSESPASSTAPAVDSTTPTTLATTTTIAPPDYSAEITRTSYGVAHIVADDWGGLGFGQGFAFAEDRACTLIDQVIKVRGERSMWFGPGDNDANLDSDFAYRHLGLHDDADERFADQPANISDMVAGYVAGFNAELAEQGPHGWCAGEPWVQPITQTDLYAYLNDVLLFASSGVLLGPIATAQPPATGSDDTAATGVAPTEPTARYGAVADLGSNGWAIGAALSEEGGGMLLGNPHFPWEGEKRLWENQLTLTTGELDVYGATLSGVPGVLIGFNEAVAWTHTVSAGYRMTLYELTLSADSPTRYVYGDTTRDMTGTDITIEVLGDDGETTSVTRTMWSSHYGPMLNLPFGWTLEKAYTMRDANIDNADTLRQFFGMDAATSMDDFIDVHRRANGIPWVNTMATSSDGRAWYADTAATPNLSPEAITQWRANVDAGGLAKVVLDNGAVLLDGSDPINEWVDDPAATRPGILPFDQQPQLERDDYVFNANDSHWIVNPAQPLTGYSPLTGNEFVPQSARTRMNIVLLDDPAMRGDDGLFSLTELQDALFSNRGIHGELLLADVLEMCDRTPLVLVDEKPYETTAACNTLRGWDGRYNLTSAGAPLWREFISRFSYAEQIDGGALYEVWFDPADPAGTPNTLNDSDDQATMTKLALAGKDLVDAGFAIDSTLGEMQFDGRLVDERIPLPGGQSVDGVANIVGCCADDATLAPGGDPGEWSSSGQFSDKGYPVTDGASFVLTVEFTADGPHAAALLTYGQPDDPADPNFIAQTKLFSRGEFRPALFTRDDVEADAVSTITVSGYKD